MSDNEIIKILDSVGTGTGVALGHHSGKVDIISGRFKELIGENVHHKVEIERLQKSLEEAVSCFNRMESLYKIKCKELEIAKSEARKEFAERLKEEMSCEDDCGYHCSDCYYECKDYVPVINNVLREMEK